MGNLKVVGVALIRGLIGVEAGPCKPASLPATGLSTAAQLTEVTETTSTTIVSEVATISAIIDYTSAIGGSELTTPTTLEVSFTTSAEVTSSETILSLTIEETTTATTDPTVLASTREETSATTSIDITTTYTDETSTTAIVTTATSGDETPTTAALAPVATNELINPSFDEPSDTGAFDASPWTLVRTGVNRGVLEVKESSADFPSRTGNHAIYIGILTPGGSPSIKQTVTGLDPESQYVVSAWVAYTNTLNPAIAPKCTADLWFGGIIVARHSFKDEAPLEYKKVEFTVTPATSQDTVQVYLYCFVSSGPGIGMMVDDVSLVKIL